jgi:uncharacterized membrane protein
VNAGAWGLLISSFLASAVETVEAFTIVLAVGITRGWKSTMLGVLAAVGVLAVLVVFIGPGLVAIPLDALRLVVGALLLIFGLQWLRKAILRSSGYKAMHDEVAIFAAEAAQAREQPPTDRSAFDQYAFSLSFKGVFLEGLEVVFIVLTFGAIHGDIPLAALGATAAVILVVLVGVAVRAPLSKVPENTLKFTVGVMLTSFGIFWGAEGAGVTWPGNDAALPVIVIATAGCALAASAGLRRERERGDLVAA